MDNIELKEKYADELSKAGFSADGHVTHGSLEAQMEVIDKMVIEVQERWLEALVAVFHP